MTKFVILCMHCDYDFSIAFLLKRYGFDFVIFRLRQASGMIKDINELGRNKIVVGDRDDLLSLIKKGDIVINGTNSLFYTLGLKRIFYYLFFKRNKIITWPTGSDISELSVEKTFHGFVYRFLLHRSILKVIPPYPYVLRNLKELNISNYFLLKYPYFLKKLKPVDEFRESKVIFFCPSNIDFCVTDNKKNRNSSKGTDRFLRAFLRAYQENNSIKCIFLDRGQDKEIAKDFVRKNCSDAFEILEPMTRKELEDYFHKVDCVVDQFDVGGFGMISMEALAQGKPVMIYINKNCWPLVYDEEPPVINCQTEDEIYHAILQWADRKKLQGLGERAEKWVRKYHDVHTADFSEFIFRVCLAAGLEWPRKDLAKEHKF